MCGLGICIYSDYSNTFHDLSTTAFGIVFFRCVCNRIWFHMLKAIYAILLDAGNISDSFGCRAWNRTDICILDIEFRCHVCIPDSVYCGYYEICSVFRSSHCNLSAFMVNWYDHYRDLYLEKPVFEINVREDKQFRIDKPPKYA